MRLALSIVHLVICVSLLIVVLVQSGKTAGLSSAIGGGGDTYLSRNKNRSFDSRVARATKWLAAAFVLLTLGLQFV